MWKETRELKGHSAKGVVVPCSRRVYKVSEFVAKVSSSSSIFLTIVKMRDAIESSSNTSNCPEQKRITFGAVAISKRIVAETKWIVVHIYVDFVHAVGTTDLAGIGAGVGVDGV